MSDVVITRQTRADHRAKVDKDVESYLNELAQHQSEPGLHVDQSRLKQELSLRGATGFSVADVLQPYQLRLDLYIGFTTPKATSEVPHWHPDQTEVYQLIEGKAEILCKHRWEHQWISRVGRAGDLLIVQREVCHWFRWLSPVGLAAVFKAPQRAGIGPFPAGKATCTKGCPHFGKQCAGPAGFSVVPD